MNKITLALVATATLSLSGCASLFNDANQTVNLTSSNGKTFKGSVDGRNFEVPGAVQVLRSKNPKVFNVDEPGCDKQTSVPSGVDVKFFGNILLGGLFGSTTDYSTDKMWKYSDTVTISCKS